MRSFQQIYKSVLLREMDDKVVSYLNKNLDKLPFDNLFGDDLRIYIPLFPSDIINDIVSALRGIKDYSGIDLETEEVIRRVKLDDKYGGGEKDMRINIGKAINGLKIDPDKKKKYLDWYAGVKGFVKEALGDSNYGIIISRAPIDILRMSDHDQLSSCHSKGGSFFYCAVQEAITGGAVAYVVKKEDALKIMTAGKLQDPEIFSDRTRKVEGIVPLSRRRLRRFESDDGESIAIPDLRTYGNNSIPGFYSSLKTFLKGKQKSDPEDFKSKDWKRRGGTSFDNEMASIFGSYYYDSENFDTIPDAIKYKRIPHSTKDVGQELKINTDLYAMDSDLQSECENVTQLFNRRYTYFYVNTEFTDSEDEAPYVTPYGELELSFPHDNLDDINFVINDERLVDGMRKGEVDAHIKWSQTINYLDKLSPLIRITSFKMYNGVMQITFNSKQDYYTQEDYANFCRGLMLVDNSLQNTMDRGNLRKDMLVTMGILASPFKDIPELVEYFNSGKNPFNDDLFYLTGRHLGELTVKLTSHALDKYLKITSNDYPFDAFTNNKIIDEFGYSLKLMMDKTYIPSKFNQLTERHNRKITFKTLLESKSGVDIKVTGPGMVYDEFEEKAYNHSIHITPDEWNQNTVDYFKHMVSMSNDVVQLLKVWCIESVHPKFRKDFESWKDPSDNKMYDYILPF